MPVQTQPTSPSVIEPLSEVPNQPQTNLEINDPQLRSYLEKQKVATEQLMTQVEQQRAELEKLKLELEQQKSENGQLVNLMRERQITPNPTEQAKTFQTGMIWAVGGIVVVLVVGGSIVLVGLIAIAAQPQRRPPRTTHVFHPVNLPNSQALPGQYPELIPPQPRTRRVHSIDRDDY
ncbi:MAG: hypothetical protein F6K24_54985 [Okeania sp. SIO2D1]|nr:hypothetical protein [Okeania sp. SIO2D1]